MCASTQSSISAVYFYRGSHLPERYGNRLFVGDYSKVRKRIRRSDVTPSTEYGTGRFEWWPRLARCDITEVVQGVRYPSGGEVQEGLPRPENINSLIYAAQDSTEEWCHRRDKLNNSQV